MSNHTHENPGAVAVAVASYFQKLLCKYGECDMLCRAATYTHALYDRIDTAETVGDTPQRLSDRIGFVRQFGSGVVENRQQWTEMTNRLARKKSKLPITVWLCPRCGSTDCAGIVEARVVQVGGESGE